MELTAQQRQSQLAFRTFVQEEIVPYADQYDREECTPPELLQKMAQQGYLGALISSEYGGVDMDMITFGLLNEELGRGCSSVRSLVTVHSMVSYAIRRWGNKVQKQLWLPRLASGEAIAAFGLSEPNAGSDAQSVETTVELQGDQYVLHGQKKWITYGQIADLFLIFAQSQGKVSAFLVERQRPGFSTEPISGMLGTRASMLAKLLMEHCQIPRENLLGGPGFGLAAVATSALEIGRYSVAWGCVGIAQACLEASLRYTQERQQFGSYLKDHQLIQQMLTNMLVNAQAARLLCYQAGYARMQESPSMMMDTWMAKYFASLAAHNAANDAVQIQGAYGCSQDSSVQRFFRDARIMEIIEGSTQIQQITIARYGQQYFA